jgi:cell wall-associated NlpC family hydrolase
LSKHRRPTRLQRLGTIAGHSPLQLSIAAGVAGTLSVTGTVVASAADSTTVAHEARGAKASAIVPQNPADLSSTTGALALKDAVTAAQEKRQHDIAKAKARAAAKRQAARQAARKAAAKARAEKQAERSRTFSSASRGVERMSASASHALQLAAAAASGAYYTHGGAGPNGFDCSGFTMYVFSQMGISLPHSAAAQRSMVRSVSSPQPGDLVFVYNGGGGSVGHVAIYAGGGYWWEASNPSVGVGKHRAWSSHVSYGRVL